VNETAYLNGSEMMRLCSVIWELLCSAEGYEYSGYGHINHMTEKLQEPVKARGRQDGDDF
jgi:hypothetical protein